MHAQGTAVPVPSCGRCGEPPDASGGLVLIPSVWDRTMLLCPPCDGREVAEWRERPAPEHHGGGIGATPTPAVRLGLGAGRANHSAPEPPRATPVSPRGAVGRGGGCPMTPSLAPEPLGPVDGPAREWRSSLEAPGTWALAQRGGTAEGGVVHRIVWEAEATKVQAERKVAEDALATRDAGGFPRDRYWLSGSGWVSVDPTRWPPYGAAGAASRRGAGASSRPSRSPSDGASRSTGALASWSAFTALASRWPEPQTAFPILRGCRVGRRRNGRRLTRPTCSNALVDAIEGKNKKR